MKLRVKLVSTGAAVDFSGYRVRLRYEQLASLAGATDVEVYGLAELAATSSAAGEAELLLDDARKPRAPFTLAVLAPDGRELATRSLDALPQGAAEFRVAPVEAPTPATATDSRATASLRLTGRVIDHQGKAPAAARLNLVLHGAPRAEDPPIAFAVYAIDAQGYFSGDRSALRFASVTARIAMPSGPVDVPLLLQDGALPPRVLIVLPPSERAPEPVAEEPCDCERPTPPLGANPDDLVNAVGTYTSDIGGSCIQFNTPNRSIDEFTYYGLVRTTDPEIKGLSLGPDRPLPPRLLAEWAKAAVSVSAAMAATDKRAEEDADRARSGAGLAGGAVPSTLAREAPGSVTPPFAGVGTTHVDLAASLPDLFSRAWADADSMKQLEGALSGVHISAAALAAVATDAESFDAAKIAAAERITAFRGLRDALSVYTKPVPGRGALDAANPIDWDHDAQFYQATTIAHGHLLHFKQVWRANGYSLGDLLYSLPLAPGQKKQIVVLDWDRREAASRTEATTVTEQLDASLVRDRDINEVVKSTLSESSRGASAAVTGGQGSIFGMLTGAVSAVAGGIGFGASAAWQSAARKFAGESLQQLRDQTLQSASSVRSQRSTVVQTAEQGESVRVTTEVVANHNHCHAITVQYFEVLRHLLVSQELVDVQECLFIPLLLSKFDSPKALRWRDTLSRYLRKRELAGGFDALERIATNYANADFPVGRFEDETLLELEGELRVSFVLPRPKDQSDRAFDVGSWGWLVAGGLLWASPLEIFNLHLRDRIDVERDRTWHREIAPRIAERFIQKLSFALRTASGTEVALNLDTTLVSRYAADVPLYVSIRPTGGVPGLTRASVRHFIIRGTVPLPPDARVTVQSGELRYRTAHLRHWLFRDTRLVNDLRTDEPDGVVVPTPTDDRERRDPRKEDRDLSRKLVAHLNENLEYFHKALFWAMDPDRRYMLLDGFIAPNSGGRSVASVVENRLIGIVGNSLVMPVARGFHLDPTYKASGADELLAHYQPTTPIPAVQVSLPTRGVFAEAVMGNCNSCEEIDNTRFWRWEESPIDDPTAIATVNTDSRRAEPPVLTPSAMPAPIVAMQTAPAAPDPTGLAAAIQLLGNPNLFRDFTGLTENQKNALSAMQSSLSSAQAVGTRLVDYAMQSRMSRDVDGVMKNIKKGVDSNLLSPEQAQKLTEEALRSTIAGGSRSPDPLKPSDIGSILQDAASSGTDVKVQRPSGESIETRAQQPQAAGVVDFSGAEPWVTLENNTNDARSFTPRGSYAVRNSGATRLRADVSFAPAGSKVQWGVSRADALEFRAPRSPVTEALAGSPGLTIVTMRLEDSRGGLLRTDTTDVGVPQFVLIRESTLRAPTHIPAMADSDLFSGLLTFLLLDTQRDPIVRIMRNVVEALLERANLRTIWQMGPFNDRLPGQFQATGSAEMYLATVDVAGVPFKELNGNPLTLLHGGQTTFHETGPINANKPNFSTPSTFIFPGVVRNPAYPEAQRIFNRLNELDVQLGTLPTAAAQAERNALFDVWKTVVGRLTGVLIAHELLHVLIGAGIGLNGGHTPAPTGSTATSLGLLAPGGAFTFADLTGLQVTDDANFPRPGSFTVQSIDHLPRPNDNVQAQIDIWFPVAPAAPFDK